MTGSTSPIAYSSVRMPGHASVRLLLTACQIETFFFVICEKFAYIPRKYEVLVRSGQFIHLLASPTEKEDALAWPSFGCLDTD